MNINGKLIGIHIVRKNGNIEHNWLREPVNNTIVHSGIKHLLRYNGTDSMNCSIHSGSNRSSSNNCPFFERDYQTYYSGSSTGPHYGIFYQMGIGTGVSATTTDMTDLESPVQETYVRRNVFSGIPFTGTRLVDKGHFEFRITHNSVVVDTDCTVSEFALYGLINSSTRVMFCRVLIPSELRPHLTSGDSVAFTYSLDWYIPDDGGGRIADIGLVDQNGNALNFGAYTQCFMSTSQNASYGSFLNADSGPQLYGGMSLRFTGEDRRQNYNSDQGFCNFMLPWKVGAHEYSYTNVSSSTWVYVTVGCAFSSNKGLPTWGGTNANFVGNTPWPNAVYTYNGDNASSNLVLKGDKKISSYIEGTNYRDYSIRISNVSSSNFNMYYFRHCGMDYRFFKIENGSDVFQPIVINSGKTLELNFRFTINTGASGIR